MHAQYVSAVAPGSRRLLVSTHRDGEAPLPAHVLGDESSHQRRDVGTVVQEQGEDARVEPALVEEKDVADDRRPEGDGRPGRPAVERPGDHDAGPVGAVSRDDVSHRRQEGAGQEERATAVDMSEGNDEERPEAGEHQVDSQLVGGLNRREAERLAERDEGRIDDGRGEGSQEGEERQLQADGQLETSRPVLPGKATISDSRQPK